MKVKEESEKVGLKLNIQNTAIMASSPITSWQIDGKTVETVSPKKPGVCLLYCFMLSPVISLGAVPHHHLALSVKELTYSSNS